jgi:hypothetical protein
VYDSGNSLPFYRNPVEEARSLLPYIKTTHIKDHVLVRDGDVVWSVGTPLGLGRIPLAEIVDVLQTAPQLSRIMTQVCYGYAVRMPAPPIDVPPLALYEPIDRPIDSHVIWTPSTDGKHGYLEPDIAHLDAAEGHVEAGVAYLRDLIGDDEG